MSHITLIRHGQANTEARDEHSYDRLSDLGHQQATWLGEHLRASGASHPRIYCGTLTRHIETAAGMGYTEEVVQDPRLNEMEYFTLAQAMEKQHGLAIPQEREGFIAHLPQVLAAWAEGEIDDAPESWSDFETRTQAALSEIAAGEGPALVVTSGGLISMAMRQAMMLEITGMARMALAIMNTSMHRLFPIGGHWSPVLFNAVPHLETPDRHFAQTHL
ncbi:MULTISPECIES: histidine phosphatase family protein [Rhodobacterales]|jgi:broad specificity phosphatase PhoE|uniref:histidine phosphatase family protein n=1 Tax=Rhodobacterales TaxID=204455 RepID=UPI00237FA942|nr:histidine phosphatase family protein [Phaeobacter gallaeciensis]MDE4141434.1 histidine phosphatase family protein [Phaeobacter gallaeciensis]MDE4149879.1 histidine phosphatase family protein [Phaeobacter gallaeciensis]MDE4154104.1 histidine phosphatase family protein [Phaeobacter gallaeciensis]MDE4229726.1 histidine phosphatase family protein [Phaeobacter gallaeciensis]MDE4258570.1 histidine phosphatase family protein [Phaeobacter gallaeciensis]